MTLRLRDWEDLRDKNGEPFLRVSKKDGATRVQKSLVLRIDWRLNKVNGGRNWLYWDKFFDNWAFKCLNFKKIGVHRADIGATSGYQSATGGSDQLTCLSENSSTVCKQRLFLFSFPLLHASPRPQNNMTIFPRPPESFLFDSYFFLSSRIYSTHRLFIYRSHYSYFLHVIFFFFITLKEANICFVQLTSRSEADENCIKDDQKITVHEIADSREIRVFTRAMRSEFRDSKSRRIEGSCLEKIFGLNRIRSFFKSVATDKSVRTQRFFYERVSAKGILP